MFTVGLTGGIASGKSTVAQRLVKHGMELIDADAIAREAALPGTPTWKKIVEHFGRSIIDEHGFIDRPALGRIVFADPGKRVLLNELTHPPVIEEIANRLELLQCFDGVVILDVPLLVEIGGQVSVSYDAVVVVATTLESQVERLCRDRGMSEDDARARVAAQAPLADKLAVATHVIWNRGTLTELEEATDRVAADLLERASAKTAAEAADIPDN
ncbi:MAG: dephospho-CoA kinase [Egibacteraceae bacterium]